MNLAKTCFTKYLQRFQIWQGWKTCIRRKLSHNRAETNATGGGEYNQVMLTKDEKTVALLSGIYKTVDGIQNTSAFGVPYSNSSEQIPSLQQVEMKSKASSKEELPNNDLEVPTSSQKQSNVSTTIHLPPNKQSREKQANVAALVHDEITAMNEISSKLDALVKVAETNSSNLQSLCKLIEKSNAEARRHNFKMEEIAMKQNEIK